MNASIGKRDPTKQGHRTPPEFLRAVEARFGKIVFDLAATFGDQATGPNGPCWTPDHDSLTRNWGDQYHKGVHWLNPPYSNIRPWVAKLDSECRDLPRWTLCLVPASMGSKWWERHVLGKCFALGVTRMQFVGSTAPYPKDLALLCYGFGVSGHGFWDWKKEMPR